MGIEANFMVGSEAGQGVESVGLLLAKAFVQGLLY
jgi:Pyruvate/2-oxoacid:ferredoxin oxidoreductase gamma subunit